MTRQALQHRASGDTFDTLIALVAADGSAAHGHPHSPAMTQGPDLARNIADVVHHIGLLHGRYPGVIDYAALRTTDAALRDGVAECAGRFVVERSLLAQLVVAVGPIPSTPGQANAEAAVLAQHHALDMLAQSDRQGCAAGAALAVVLDWAAIRRMLDFVALRVGVETPPIRLPDGPALQAMLGSATLSAGVERAMLFGAHQVIAQHRGLWDLLQARSLARHDY